MVNNPLGAYKKNSIINATPEELTLMLYDGALKFMYIAKERMKEEKIDVQKTHDAFIRAQDIIDELNATLNMDIEFSQDLRRLYEFIGDKLRDANIYKSQDILDEAIKVTTQIRDLWKDLMKAAKEQEKGLRSQV